jgi:bifunctional DNase/RNase
MSDALVEVQVVGVGQDLRGNEFVLLRDHQKRQLPIWIGRCEAYAIIMHLEEHDVPRPMTHDLLLNVIQRLGGKVQQLLIDDLWQNTFYAKVCVAQNEEVLEIDCRPSDGIALAIRAEVPILVSNAVIEEGRWREPEEAEAEDEGGDDIDL